VFSLHEETHDHADVCTAHGIAVERGHSLFAQLSQKRAVLHGTSVNRSRGATRQTTQHSAGSSAAAAAEHGAVEVVEVDAVDCSSSSSLLSLLVAGCNAVVTGG